MVNFYHRFIPHLAEITEPLHTLIAATTTKSQVLNWTDRALCAFESTMKTLEKACLLSYPSTDAPTSIVTDASDIAVGAVLRQYVNGAWKPISFFSKAMKPAERRYSTFDKELLAIYLAIKHFRHFIEGRHFHVLTDHKPLTFAMNTRSDRYSPRQSRHLDYISQFTSTIRHIKGSQNVVADALSRIETNALVTKQPPVVNFEAIAEAQSTDKQLRALQSSSSSTLRQYH